MSGSSKKSSWSDVIGEMFGGPDRDDEVTRTELVGRTGTMNSRMAAHHSPRNKRDCAAVGVCAKEIKPELNTLDEADFVRDVDKSSYHQQSQTEIGSDNPCSRQLSGIAQSIQPFIPDERNLTQILDPSTRAHSHRTSRSPCRTFGVL